MYQATKKIYDTLKATTSLKVFTEENEKNSECWLGFQVKGGGSYRIRFISHDDDNDVAVRVFELLSIPEDRILPMYEAINEANNKFRYVKFVIDGDNDLNVEYDYPVRCSNPAESAEEITIRIARIIDDAYPIFMRALWS